MPGILIPGRPVGDDKLSSEREIKARAAGLVNSIKDPDTRKALRFLIDKLSLSDGPGR